MTVNVGKTHINLGWETLAGIILFTISTTFGITWSISSYKSAQEENTRRQEAKLDRIIAKLNIKDTKDSVRDIRIDTMMAWHNAEMIDRKITAGKVDYLLHTVFRMPTSFRTERNINGKTVLTDVK